MLTILRSSFFQDDGILVIPSTPDFPHKLKGKKKMPMEYQDRAFSLLSIASMSGCCQVELLDNVSFQIFSFRFFHCFTVYDVCGFRLRFHLENMMTTQFLYHLLLYMVQIDFYLTQFWTFIRLSENKPALLLILCLCLIPMVTWLLRNF